MPSRRQPLSILWATAFGVVTCAHVAAQDQSPALALPEMVACSTTARPVLPPAWGGTFLMAPFIKAQLVLAELAHDGAVPATRTRLYGLKRGTLDLLVLGRNTYALTSEDGQVKECRNLGDTGWRPVARYMLPGTAQCVGAAPVGEMSVNWWRMPAAQPPLASWMWFKQEDGTPFRLMFAQADETLAPLSWFASSHQVGFGPLQAGALAEVAALCRAAKPAASGNARERLRGMVSGLSRADARADGDIRRLMPELAEDCAGTSLPRWPDAFATTTFMTPLDVRHAPFPAQVLYDWRARAQRTRLSFPPSSPTRHEDALLVGPRGYDVTQLRKGGRACTAPQPGTVRPDWTSAGGCKCETVINGKTPLTPYGSAQIINCPMTSPRVVWTWYTLDGRPMTFMETSSDDETGALLTLADYYAWVPGHQAPEDAFAPPAQCLTLEASSRTAPRASVRIEPRPCGACHLEGAPR